MTAPDHRADPFSRPTLDSNAVDLAWVRYRGYHLSRRDACRAMTDAGLVSTEADAALDSTTLPSTARMLAGVSA